MSVAFFRRLFGRLGLASLLATTAAAWVPMPTGVWPDGNVAMAFEFGADAPPAGIAWNAVSADALGVWNTYLQRIKFVRDTSQAAPAYDNERNELFFSTHAYDEPFPDGVLAITFVTTEDDRPIEADIVFNALEAWGLYSGKLHSDNLDFKRVALHELGHVLGIDHPNEAGQGISAIMNAVISDIDAPTADDRAAAHGLYDFGPGAAPMILDALKSSNVTAGAAATLHVVAGGRGPFGYIWKHNGTIIAGASSPTLELPVATSADQGDYTVTVSSAAGAVTSERATLSVSPASFPQVIMARTEETVTIGEDVTLGTTLAYGSEPLSYEWRKNGVFVGRGDGGSFTVHDAQYSDAGAYTLTLSDYAGSVTGAPVHLAVVPRMAPRFTRNLESRAVLAGNDLVLSPEISGSRPMTYLWRENGAILATQAQGTLSIYAFSTADAGNYTLTVRNAYGETTSDPCALTTLAVRPVINSQSTSFSEFPGARVDLFVDATSPNGVLAIQWFKDGVAVVDSLFPSSRVWGAQQRSLIITNLTAADAGNYKAEVVGFGGVSTTYDIHVEVLAPPKPLIVTQPSPHTVVVGGKVSLTVGARGWFANRAYFSEGKAGYTYQWFKEGQPVAGQTSATCEFIAQASDAGRYFARVSSAGGATDSDTVDVEIKSSQPMLTAHPFSVLYDPSDSETLRLGAIAFEIQMRRVFRESGYTGIYSFMSGGNAVDSPFSGGSVRPGTYTLLLGQNGVTETSKPFSLGFQPPMIPVIIAHPRSQAADPGQTVTLAVQAVGYAALSYQWLKDGVALPGATAANLVLPAIAATDAGSYRVAVSDAAGTTVSDSASISVRDVNPPVITRHPASADLSPGADVSFTAEAVGGSLRYQWSKNAVPIPGATSATYALTQVTAADAGTYSVTVNNGASGVTSRSALLTVLIASNIPIVTRSPADTLARLGGEATLAVVADGVPPPTHFQWRKDGVDLPGATDSELRLQRLTATDAGHYTVVVSNEAGTVNSSPATLTIDSSARLVNLSSRARVGLGDDVLISGFVIAGDHPRTVLIRGVGEQMREYGLNRVLRNPLLTLFDAKGQKLASNDNWDPGDDSFDHRQQRQAIEAAASLSGAFTLHRDSPDSVLLTTLTPGVYSAIISGVAGTSGVALVEIYEVGTPSNDRLVNISSRAFVRTGDDILIAGLVLNGATPHRVLIRGVGPGLTQYGVKNPLADPALYLHRGSEVIASNDNWGDAGGADRMRTTAAVVGAFPLSDGSRDAAILIDLPAGVYSVHVAGADGGMGVALLEIYEVSP